MKTLLDKESLVFNQQELGCVLSLPELPGGGSKIHDRSPYANIGTITGATWVRLPTGLWCLSFDGTDDYADCGSSASLRITDNLSIEFWINIMDGCYSNVLGRWGGVDDRSYCVILTSEGDGSLRYNASDNGEGGAHAKELVANANLSVGTWYHIVVTHSGTTAKIYINGSLDNTNTGMLSGIHAGATVFYVGKIDSGYSGKNLKGSIALLKVYNKILSALEIQNRFNQEKHLFGVW